MKSRVALIPCDSYDEEKVYAAVKEGFSLLGGVKKFVKPEDRLLVKVNALSNSRPEKGITTNPAVFGAVLRCLREDGICNIKYGDSPGNPLTDPKGAMKDTGLLAVGEKYGAVIGNFSEAESVKYKEGKKAKSFLLCKAAGEADVIFDVCKMKTHALTKITGAIKNQYGFIYGLNKAAGHARYTNSKTFSEMLVDLNRCLGIRLHIMDGVVAMEGNGPASGDLVNMNVILMSEDPVALDSVFSKLVFLDPEMVYPCVAGEKYGLGTMNYDNIEILTPEGEISAKEAAAKYGKPDFNVERKLRKTWSIPILNQLGRKYHDRPVANLDVCIGCGVCEEACPVDGKAVHSGKGKKAEYNYKKCIRCYCCQEMCPVGAIKKDKK